MYVSLLYMYTCTTSFSKITYIQYVYIYKRETYVRHFQKSNMYTYTKEYTYLYMYTYFIFENDVHPFEIGPTRPVYHP